MMFTEHNKFTERISASFNDIFHINRNITSYGNYSTRKSMSNLPLSLSMPTG